MKRTLLVIIIGAATAAAWFVAGEVRQKMVRPAPQSGAASRGAILPPEAPPPLENTFAPSSLARPVSSQRPGSGESVGAVPVQDWDEVSMPARDRFFDVLDKRSALGMRLEVAYRKFQAPDGRPLGDAARQSKEYIAAKAQADELGRQLSELGTEIGRAREEMRLEMDVLNGHIYQARQKELADKATAEVPNGRKLGFDLMTYPRVDGSTSMHPLQVLIACRLLGSPCEWGRWQEPRQASAPSSPSRPARRGDWEGYLAQYWLMAATASPEQDRRGRFINQILVQHYGTHKAYLSLMQKSHEGGPAVRTSDFALIAREPSRDELRQASRAGVKLDAQPVALDAFVFVVNRKCPVRGLTTDQLKAIYTGKITSWSEFGGPDRKIRAYQREANSGSQELMLNVFMKDTPIGSPHQGPENLIELGMAGPFYRLTEDAYGIAYSVYYYEHFMAASPYTRPLAVDGVEPTYETIQSGRYPYVTKVYAVIRVDEPVDSPARQLRDWLLTAEGQAVVQESGYVPLPASNGR